MRKAFGIILSVFAWLFAAMVVCGAVLYANYCVVWLHAPVISVLVITVSGTWVLLILAWACNKIGVRIRTESDDGQRPKADI